MFYPIAQRYLRSILFVYITRAFYIMTAEPTNEKEEEPGEIKTKSYANAASLPRKSIVLLTTKEKGPIQHRPFPVHQAPPLPAETTNKNGRIRGKMTSS